MRRAKIVCTLGPAVSTPDKIRELVDAGMDVARLNLSHGSHADHELVYEMVRRASDESGHAIGIFADLQGPKIRLGKVAAGPVEEVIDAPTLSDTFGMSLQVSHEEGRWAARRRVGRHSV